MAWSAPTLIMPVMNLTCHLEKAAKHEDIENVVKQALEGPLKRTLHHTEDQAVSCYFNSDAYSSTFDGRTGISLNFSFLV